MSSGPHRDVLKMIMSSVTTRSLQPRMPSIKQFVAGRIYSIFGYDCRIHDFGRSLGNMFPVGTTVSVLAEGLDWESRERLAREGKQ